MCLQGCAFLRGRVEAKMGGIASPDVIKKAKRVLGVVVQIWEVG